MAFNASTATSRRPASVPVPVGVSGVAATAATGHGLATAAEAAAGGCAAGGAAAGDSASALPPAVQKAARNCQFLH